MKKLSIFFLCAVAGIFSVHAQTSYREYYDRALELAGADSLAQAEYFFKEALRAEPANVQNALIFSNLGVVQHRMGKYEMAVESFSLALNLLPDYVPVLLNRASAHLELGEVSRALADYTHVLAIDSHQTEALLMRAYIFMSRREYPEARADYEQLLQTEPQSYAGRLGVVTLEQQVGRHPEALMVLNGLITEFPEEEELYIIRANLHVDMDQTEAALLDLEEAIRLNEDNPIPYCIRGEIFLAQKKNAWAGRNFEKAISLGYPASELREQLKRIK